MFTPPPSPHPSGLRSFSSSLVPPLTQDSAEISSSRQDAKRKLGRRFRCVVIVVPLIVVVLTACTRFSPSPTTQESLRLFSWRGLGGELSWKVHKRSPQPQAMSSPSDSASQSVSST